MPTDDFESFLRQFQLLSPAPLPPSPSRQRLWWRPVLAAVAALLLVIGVWRISVRPLQHGHPMERQVIAEPTLGDLQSLLDDPARLDTVLDAQSTRLLPNVETSSGALGFLAKP